MGKKSTIKTDIVACVEQPAEAVHRMLHDACYELSNGNNKGAHDILAKADRILHIMCNRVNDPSDVPTFSQG